MKVLTAHYELDRHPVSYDFIAWLIRAKWEADEGQCTHMHVAIDPTPEGRCREWGNYDAAAAQWRLWHIIVPACTLVGASVTVSPMADFDCPRWTGGMAWRTLKKRDHVVASLVELAKAGAALPKLKATEAARRYVRSFLDRKIGPFATITSRNLPLLPEKNSRWNDLWEFQLYLEGQGYRVFWIEDTDVAMAKGAGYAELDVDLRLALYEACALNIIGNNGPAALLEHSSAPYIRTGGGQVEDWEQNHGLKHGEQLPWARARQLIWYGPDTFDELKKAYSAWAGATS